MTLRQYLALMLVSTALSWFGWRSVVRYVDPIDGGLFALLLFYVTLALSLLGTLSVAGLLVRAAARSHEAVARHVAASFRQGLLLTGLAVTALVLQGSGRLSGANLLLLIGVATLCEFFLISADLRNKKGL